MKSFSLAVVMVCSLCALIMSPTAFAAPAPPEPKCVGVSKDAGARVNAAGDAFRRAFGAEAANRGTDAGDALWDGSQMLAVYPTVYGLASIIVVEYLGMWPKCPYQDSNGTPTANAGPASDAQCKADWERVQKGNKSVDELSNEGHNLGLSANSHLDRVLSRKLSAPQKQSASALRDVIKSFAGTSDSCVNEFRSLARQTRPKEIPVNAARGVQAVGGAIAGGNKVAGDSIKTGSQVVGGAVAVATTGAVDAAGRVVNNPVGIKTRELVDSGKRAVDRGVTGGVGGSVDAGKRAVETGKGAIATAGAAAASAAAAVTSFDGALGSLFSIHLDRGTAMVSPSEATLDGAITISLKSSPAARVTFNGHLLLKGGAASGSPVLAAQQGATSHAAGSVQTIQGAVAANAGVTASGASAGVAIRNWGSLEGRGAVTASPPTRSVVLGRPLAGTRTFACALSFYACDHLFPSTPQT